MRTRGRTRCRRPVEPDRRLGALPPSAVGLGPDARRARRRGGDARPAAPLASVAGSRRRAPPPAAAGARGARRRRDGRPGCASRSPARPSGGEPGAQRGRRARNRGEAKAARTPRQPDGRERGGLLGREPEVAGADRGRAARAGRSRSRAGRGGARRSRCTRRRARSRRRGRARSRRPRRRRRSAPGRGSCVVGQVGHQPSSPRNRPIEPSSRSRSASRPRWIRDFTVPSETPVSSAISCVVVALDVEQDDRVPLVGRDRRQRRGQHARPLAVHRRPDGVVLRAGRRLPALVVELRVGLGRAALLEPLLVHRRVDRDPAEPRADAAAAERAHVAVGGEERLLDGVARPGRGPEPCARRARTGGPGSTRRGC